MDAVLKEQEQQQQQAQSQSTQSLPSQIQDNINFSLNGSSIQSKIIKMPDNCENPAKHNLFYETRDPLYNDLLQNVISFDFLQEMQQESVTQDGGVIRFYSTGEKEKRDAKYGLVYAKEGDKVRIDKEGRKTDGSLIDQETRKFKLFRDNLVQGVHIASASLRLNETGWFKIAPSYHFHSTTDKSIIDPQISEPYNKSPLVTNANDSIFYKIKLIEIESDWETQNKDMLAEGDIQKQAVAYIDILEKKKAFGNNLFQQKEYKRACKSYNQAINQKETYPNKVIDSFTAEQKQQILILMSVLHGNYAQCLMRLNDFVGGKQHAEKSLTYQKNNVKNNYRLADCLSKIGGYNADAIRSFQTTIALLKQDPETSESAAQIKDYENRISVLQMKIKKEDMKEKAACKNMFTEQNIEFEEQMLKRREKQRASVEAQYQQEQLEKQERKRKLEQEEAAQDARIREMLKPKDSDPDWLKREREKESSLAGGVQGGDLEHVINSLQNGLVLQNEEQMNKLLLNAIM